METLFSWFASLPFSGHQATTDKDMKPYNSLSEVSTAGLAHHMDVKSDDAKSQRANAKEDDKENKYQSQTSITTKTGKERNQDVMESIKMNNNVEKPSNDDSDRNTVEQGPVEDIITQDMIDEETSCHTKAAEEDQLYGKQAMEELEATIREQRSARLHHLLEKSNFYAKFLLERIESQKQKEGERAEKEKAKKERELEQAALQDKKVDTTPTNTKVTRSTRHKNTNENDNKSTPKRERQRKRRKESSEQYNIADVIDEETIERVTKKRKMEDENNNSQDGGNKENSKMENAASSKSGNGSVKKKNPIYENQPTLLTGGKLRSYQLVGVEWLTGLYENGINGILADEMGLGKTVQCIGLVAHIIEQGVKGPFLIVGPLSTLPNWVREFKRFAPTINTLLYHGKKEIRPDLRKKIMQLKGKVFKSAPVVITSYEMVMADRQDLQSYPWKFIVVDEGHRLKNLNCKLIQELKKIKSANRLLLTGTPLQNNLAELWSLLNFLLPAIFDDLNSFQSWFDFSEVKEEGGYEKIIAKEEEKAVLQKLHAILTPFLLRRLKTDVDITIPPKMELLVYAPFSKKQEEFYKQTLDKTIYHTLKKKHTQKETEEDATTSTSGRPMRRSVRKFSLKAAFQDDSEADDDEKYFEDLLEAYNKAEEERKEAERRRNKVTSTAELTLSTKNMLMQLRKCCNHPYLIEYPLNQENNEYLIDENIVRCCGKMMLLDRMLAKLKSRGHKVLIFSQMTKMLDIIQDYCWLRKYNFSRLDGSMAFEDRNLEIEKFNEDADVFIFLLSTRAGGLGINLATADTVIIYDSDWNPQADLQAQDRAHRIGQTKPVVVYRFVTANTIDQKIVETAGGKRKLEKMVIHKGRFKGSAVSNSLTSSELLQLLDANEQKTIAATDDANDVISEDMLEKLLDRTMLDRNRGKGNQSDTTDASCCFKRVDSTQESLAL